MGGNTVHFDAGGYTLRARVYGGGKKPNPRPAALFLRGWSPGMPWSDMDLSARFCARKFGIVCLSVQFRGMGSPGDAGKLSRSGFLNDVVASYDYLTGIEGVDRHSILAVGVSFGGYMACLLGARRDLKGLLLRVPTDFPNEGFDDKPQALYVANRTREWKLQRHEPAESFALEALSRFSGDMLIVESECDKIVPHQTIENYIAATSGRAKHVLMKNAGHGLISPRQMLRFYRMETGWLKEYI